eukprot:59594_1
MYTTHTITDTDDINPNKSDKPRFADLYTNMYFQIGVVSVFIIVVVSVPIICVCLFRKKRARERETMKQVAMMKTAVNAMNQRADNNALDNDDGDEDEIMDSEEDSTDSLYVNKHANEKETTTCRGDDRNQGSNQVQSMIHGVSKVLDEIEGKGEDKVEMGYMDVKKKKETMGSIETNTGIATKQTHTLQGN